MTIRRLISLSRALVGRHRARTVGRLPAHLPVPVGVEPGDHLGAVLRRRRGRAGHVDDHEATPCDRATRATPTRRPFNAASLDRLHSTPVDRPNPFGWLDGDQQPRDRRLRAGPARGRRRSCRRSPMWWNGSPGPPLSLCSIGGWRGGTSPSHCRRTVYCGAPPSPHPTAARRRAPGRVLATALATAAIVVIGWLGVQTLIEATQSRPEPAERHCGHNHRADDRPARNRRRRHRSG